MFLLSNSVQGIQSEQRLPQQLGWQGGNHQTIFPQGGDLIQKAEDALSWIALEQSREDRLDPLTVVGHDLQHNRIKEVVATRIRWYAEGMAHS